MLVKWQQSNYLHILMRALIWYSLGYSLIWCSHTAVRLLHAPGFCILNIVKFFPIVLPKTGLLHEAV